MLHTTLFRKVIQPKTTLTLSMNLFCPCTDPFKSLSIAMKGSRLYSVLKFTFDFCFSLEIDSWGELQVGLIIVSGETFSDTPFGHIVTTTRPPNHRIICIRLKKFSFWSFPYNKSFSRSKLHRLYFVICFMLCNGS